jgi:hypothetical protein
LDSLFGTADRRRNIARAVDRNFSQQISAINEGDGAAGGRDGKLTKKTKW